VDVRGGILKYRPGATLEIDEEGHLAAGLLSGRGDDPATATSVATGLAR